MVPAQKHLRSRVGAAVALQLPLGEQLELPSAVRNRGSHFLLGHSGQFALVETGAIERERIVFGQRSATLELLRSLVHHHLEAGVVAGAVQLLSLQFELRGGCRGFLQFPLLGGSCGVLQVEFAVSVSFVVEVVLDALEVLVGRLRAARWRPVSGHRFVRGRPDWFLQSLRAPVESLLHLQCSEKRVLSFDQRIKKYAIIIID